MSAPVALGGGVEGELVGFDGKLVSLISPRAFAPGQPAEFTLSGEPPRTYAGRSIGSRRREDGRFDVRMRLVNLTREARESLQAAALGDAR